MDSTRLLFKEEIRSLSVPRHGQRTLMNSSVKHGIFVARSYLVLPAALAIL